MTPTSKPAKRTNFSPQTFSKVLSILDNFTMLTPELTAKEIGAMNDISTSSLYRYLYILEEHGYLTKNCKTNRYSLGLRLLELGGVAMCRMDFRRHGQPALDRISSELEINANMGVLYKGDLLHIAFSIWVSGEPNYSVVGRRTPAHCTAMGKTILSSLPLSDSHEIIRRYGWRPKRYHSISNFEDFDAEVAKIRRLGYATDDQEANPEKSCLAFPVLDQSGIVVAAISVTTTPDRFHSEFDRIFECVKRNVEMTSYHMGYIGPYPVINVTESGEA